MLQAEQTPAYLTDVLGAPPKTVAGRQAWSGVAWEIESYRDAHPGAPHDESDRGVQAALGRCPEWYSEAHAWTYLAGRIAHGRDLIAVAERTTADEQATERRPQLLGEPTPQGRELPRSEPGPHHRAARARNRLLIRPPRRVVPGRARAAHSGLPRISLHRLPSLHERRGSGRQLQSDHSEHNARAEVP